MIVSVVGLLGLHNGATWFHKARAAYRAAGRTVVRMDVSQRRQHLILLISFIVLAVTGFALRFPDSMVFWMLGTEEVRRWLHRAAGVILLGLGGWHLVYIAASAEGRRLVKDLWLRPQDWRDLKKQVGYLAGRHTERAKFGRFGYAEKIEYWAVVWGDHHHGGDGSGDLAESGFHPLPAPAGWSMWPSPSTITRRFWPASPSWFGISTM
jgi:hypothetical protein